MKQVSTAFQGHFKADKGHITNMIFSCGIIKHKIYSNYHVKEAWNAYEKEEKCYINSCSYVNTALGICVCVG
ncbi:hypothetical protein RFZ47_19685, partial [Acinetobacter baumannii]|nr:hypothetical protein [Acinetobacter baumannii]